MLKINSFDTFISNQKLKYSDYSTLLEYCIIDVACMTCAVLKFNEILI